MGNEIITAGVNINVAGRTSGGRVAGGNSSDKILKDLLKEFKSGNRLADQIGKKALSFGAKGGATASITAAIVAGFAALTALAGSTEKPEGQFSMFQKAISPEGEEKVLEFDQLTGEIVDIITMREAEERGILTATGEIRLKYSVMTDAIEKNIGHLESQRDWLIITDEKIESIANESVKQEFYAKEITRFNKIIAERLAKEASENFKESNVGLATVTPNRQATILDRDVANDLKQIDTTKNKKDEVLDTFMETNQSSGSIYLDSFLSGGMFEVFK